MAFKFVGKYKWLNSFISDVENMKPRYSEAGKKCIDDFMNEIIANPPSNQGAGLIKLGLLYQQLKGKELSASAAPVSNQPLATALSAMAVVTTAARAESKADKKSGGEVVNSKSEDEKSLSK